MSTETAKPTTAGWVLVALLAITPLVKSSVDLEGYLLPRTLFFGLITIAAGALLLFQKKGNYSIPAPALVWLALFAWFLLGLGTIYSAPEWWFTTLRFGLYGGFLIAFISLFRSKTITYSDFGKGMSIFAIIGGLMALGAFANAKDVYEAVAPFGHKNFTSAALLISLLASLQVYQSKIKNWNFIAIAGIVIATLAIILLRTRGVWIAAILSSATLVICNRFLKPKELSEGVIPTKYLGIAIGILLVGIIAVVSMPQNKGQVFDNANVEFRFKYWQSSLEMVAEEPLTGVGAGQWKINFPKYGLDGTNTRVSNGETAILRPHNDILWMMSEGGIPGALLFIGFFSSVIFIGVSKLMKTSNLNERMSIMSALAIIVAMLTYGLGEFPIERVSISIPTFIAAAWILKDSKSLTSSKWIASGIVLIIGVLVTHNAAQRLGVQQEIQEIEEGNNRQDPGMIIRAYQRHDMDVIDIDAYANPIPYFNGLATMVTGNQTNSNNLIREARESFDYSLELHPWHVATYNQYGNWYKAKKQYQEALDLYEKGLAISPFNIELRLNRAEIKLLTNNPAGCARHLLYMIGQDDLPKYRRLVVQSLRQIKTQGLHDAINDFMLETDVTSMNDRQLFMAFIRYRDRQ